MAARTWIEPCFSLRVARSRYAHLGLASAGHTRWGGALGVGWEYGFSPNWSFGIEYDHLWMGRDNRAFPGVVTAGGFTLVGSGVSQDVDLVTLRLNYRFGGYGAPVTARY